MTCARWLLAVLAVVAALSGCADVAADVAHNEDTGDDVFARFPACEPPEAEDAAPADVPGLLLPEDAILTASSRTGPITDVTAYVPLTPLDVRAFYEGRTDVEILQLEDEVFETEVLLADGQLRSYVIARAACREGSHITGFVAPASAVAALPTPAGGAGP